MKPLALEAMPGFGFEVEEAWPDFEPEEAMPGPVPDSALPDLYSS